MFFHASSTHTLRRTMLAAALLLPGLLACNADKAPAAAGSVATTDAVQANAATANAALNLNEQGVILRGYDPVAYFTDAKATPGSSEFSAMHDGATYHFASAANRDAFVAQPEAYAPAYGGYCAMGVAIDKKLDGDPEQWTVRDGRLFVNVNADAQGMWRDKFTEHLASAEANWPTVRDRVGFDKM